MGATAVKDVSRCAADSGAPGGTDSAAGSAASDDIDWASQDGTGFAARNGTDCSAEPGGIHSGSLNETAHRTIASVPRGCCPASRRDCC